MNNEFLLCNSKLLSLQLIVKWFSIPFQTFDFNYSFNKIKTISDSVIQIQYGHINYHDSDFNRFSGEFRVEPQQCNMATTVINAKSQCKILSCISELEQLFIIKKKCFVG